MIGLFINTVPVRVRIDPAEPARALLDRLQDEQSRADRAPVPRPRRHPAHRRARRAVRHAAGVRELPGRRRRTATVGCRSAGTDGHDATHYPLTLIAEPGDDPARSPSSTGRTCSTPRTRTGSRRWSRRSSTLWCPAPDAPVGRSGLIERAAVPAASARSSPGHRPRCPSWYRAQVARHAGRGRAGRPGRDRPDLPRTGRARRPPGAGAAPRPAPDRRRWSRLRCPARSSWSSRSTRWSGPAPPTCRSTWPTRTARLATMLADARPVAVLTTSADAPRIAGADGVILLDRPLDDPRVGGHRARAAAPGVRHLHLRLDRRGPRASRSSTPASSTGCAGCSTSTG